ncbi:tyrosine-type recombinase/integrase [Primorskyibacter sp. 2E233]|uniref:tyrosine-type recombinase/integrase n=1 Tax=Primorskyibacter sp. 2E233 TaxID=3413431 RepID=UPI003BEFFCF1
MTTDDSGMKLPRYVQRRPSGLLRYQRNVPKALVTRLGRSHIYRNLGHSYDEMIRKLPKAHSEVEALFKRTEAETSRDRTLAIVEANFGSDAAQMLSADVIDENLEYALWDLHQQLEDEVDEAVMANLVSASLPAEKITLDKAFELYADYKDAQQNKKLQNSLHKTREDLRAAIGAVKLSKLPLSELKREDALKYRDSLLQRVSPNSVTRYINIVRAVVNFVIDERGLIMKNPFHNLRVKGAGNTATDRLSLTPEEALSGLHAMGPRKDLRAIYVTLWETGARLAEITGLQVQDVNLQDRSLHIRSNAIRGLKTTSSARILPLSDRVVAALQELRQGKEEGDAIFERYGRPGGNTAASALMMKRFRKVIPDPKKSLHSLRHKKKDDLRRVGCPEEISKAILGHSNAEVAARYGSGYGLDSLRDWMDKATQEKQLERQ